MKLKYPALKGKPGHKLYFSCFPLKLNSRIFENRLQLEFKKLFILYKLIDKLVNLFKVI